MHKHVKALREFYVAARAGNPPSAYGWSEAFVDQWLAMLRLHPCEDVFELRAKGAGCSACNPPGATPSKRTVHVFPGGALMTCNQCGRRWIEPE